MVTVLESPTRVTAKAYMMKCPLCGERANCIRIRVQPIGRRTLCRDCLMSIVNELAIVLEGWEGP